MKAIEGQILRRQLQALPPHGHFWAALRGGRWLHSAKGPSNLGSTAEKIAFELQGLLVLAVAIFFHAHLAPYGVDVHHDGIMFKPALDVSQGKMVFRDTFTQYGAMTVLLQAAALKLFGARLIVLKLETAVTYGLAFYLFWRAWGRLMPSVVVTFVCLVATFMAPDSIASSLPWSSVFGLFFQSVSLLCAMRFLERGREYELVVSGAAAAFAFWCRQPVGVFLATGMLGALVLIAMQTPPYHADAPGRYSVQAFFGRSWFGRAFGVAVLYGGGTLIVNGAILLWLAHYDALIHWWKQSIVLAQIWSKSTGQGYSLARVMNCLFPGGDTLIWGLLASPIAIQVIRATTPFLDPKAALKKGLVPANALLISIVGATSWLQYFPVPCNYHCYWAGVPMFGVFAYLFYSTHDSASRVLRSCAAIGVTGLLFYNDVKFRIDSVEPHIASQNVPITRIPALRGMHTNFAEAQSYDALQALIDNYLRERPEGTLITTTSDGLFPALGPKQAYYHPFYMYWTEATPRLYPEAPTVLTNFIKDQLPLVVGDVGLAEYVTVARLHLWGYSYNVNAPRSTHPTEFVDCNGAGTCTRRPL